MFRLVYSNQTEKLLEALVADIEQARSARGALETITLVVPNRNVEEYVRFGLARATGIAANLEVSFLEGFVKDLVSPRGSDVRLLDATRLQGLVLALLLDDEAVAGRELAPVRAWLSAAGEAAIDVRRVQLSEQLSRLFQEYGYSRAEMLAAWRRGATLGNTPHAATERWQRRIWLDLFGDDGLAARRSRKSGKRWTGLGDALELLGDAKLQLPNSVHVFGFSYVARVFHEAYARLAARTELRVYALNPCEEFWEDVDTGRGDRARFPRRGERAHGAPGDDEASAFSLDDPLDTPLLRLWGRPGRENVRLLNQLADCDFVAAFADPVDGGETLLRRLQSDILHRAPEPVLTDDPDAAAVDDSLVVHACPGIRREVETVASEIWRLVREDARAGVDGAGAQPLRFNDIAVIVGSRDQQEYLSHVSSVFREAHDIPHNVVDLSLASESRIATAVALLLSLPLGAFGRSDLLRLATHPAVAGRFPDADPEDWLAWCDRLGVVHGGDHDDHAGTYISKDVFNFGQGIRRLALGAFMTGEPSGDDRPFVLGDQAYLPEELSQSSQGSAAALGLLLRSLIADSRFAKNARMPLAEWASFLRALVTTYVRPSAPDDERDLVRCLSALQGIERLEIGEREVSYRVVHALATAALSGLGDARGNYLADGVVVSSFVPMRAIPFRVVFVLGLGEGKFPTPDRNDSLDLRQAKRRSGDVSPRDRDRYMFLETLVSARDALHLSYVARDGLTGEELSPSAVVVELLHVLERGYVGRAGRAKVVRAHPLRRHEAIAPGAPCALPEARREARAAALGGELRSFAGTTRLPPLDELEKRLSPDVRAALLAELGVVVPPEPVAFDPAGPVRISLTTLRQFLECPLQGWARFALGLADDEDEDVLAKDSEPFATSRRDRAVVLREAFLDAVRTGAPLADAYGRQIELGQRRGTLPTGMFAEAERGGHLAVLEAWRGMLDAIAGPGAGLSVVRFGQAEEHARVDALVDAISLEVTARGKPVHVELYGRTEPLVASGSVTLVVRDQADAGRVQKDVLRGFVDFAALAACGRREGQPHAAHVLAAPAGGGSPSGASFAPIARDEARAWLSAVVSDLLSGPHDYLLPIEAVIEARTKGVDLALAVDALRSSGRATYSSTFGPVPHPERYPTPPPDEAEAIVRRRYSLFFDRRVMREEPAS